MTTKELITHLSSYPEDMQVLVAGDEEHNTMFTSIALQLIELNKTNNDGTYDAISIFGLSGSEIE